MKKINIKQFRVMILALMICGAIDAQVPEIPVFTPNGTQVNANSRAGEGSLSAAALAAQALQWIANQGWTGQITMTGAGTASYNCHGWAWAMSDGTAGQFYIKASQVGVPNEFFNDPYDTPPILVPDNINKYWTDGSYNPGGNYNTVGAKVWFGESNWRWDNMMHIWVDDSDHSAVVVSSGMFESKWSMATV
jgi:hypothetical protein